MSKLSFLVLGATADPWALISTAHSPLAFEGPEDLISPQRVLLGLPGYSPKRRRAESGLKGMRKHISQPSQSADVSGGRINHRRQLKQRRRLVDAAYLGGGWRRRPEKKSWDWRGSSGPTVAVGVRRLAPVQAVSISDPRLASPTRSNRYYQESIDLSEDSILSDDLLEALSKPLSGRPVRPRHALAGSRLTSRPARHNQPRRGQIRKIDVR